MYEFALIQQWQKFPPGTTFLAYPVEIDRTGKFLKCFRTIHCYYPPRNLLKDIDGYYAKKEIHDRGRDQGDKKGTPYEGASLPGTDSTGKTQP